MPAYFHNTIITSVYGPDGPHLHQLAVLFAVTAISTLLDPTLMPLAPTPREYHETAYSCLVAGKFFTDTTLDSLITLSLIGTYLLNADDKKSPDANFAVFGLGLRLAIIAGYHRDPALMYPDIPLDEMDQRRRVFHEILASDRLHVSRSLNTRLDAETWPPVYARSTSQFDRYKPLRYQAPIRRRSKGLLCVEVDGRRSDLTSCQLLDFNSYTALHHASGYRRWDPEDVTRVTG